jgi:SAM-dependent methyltransferase
MLTHDFKDGRMLAIAAEPVTRYPIEHADLVFRGSCAVCGATNFDEAASVYIGRLCVHQTVICKQCTFSWRALSPTDDWFTRMAELLPPYKRPYSAARFAAYRKRAEMVAPYVKHDAHVLDVGAASYEGVDAFKEAGYLDVCGVEPMGDGTSIEQLCEEQLLDFNLIVMSHVLEHCRDPLSVMRGLKRILKPKGVVYLELPHAFQIINWSDAFYFAHKCNFTWESMSTILKHAGYKVLNERSVKFDDADRRDMSFILTDGEYGPPYVGDNSGIRAMIKDQYTAGLPIRVESPPQYEIPYVDHFHYGLRFNRWDVHKQGSRIVMMEKASDVCTL